METTFDDSAEGDLEVEAVLSRGKALISTLSLTQLIMKSVWQMQHTLSTSAYSATILVQFERFF